MDNIRLILIMTLAFILLLLYQAWQEDYGPQKSQTPEMSLGTPSTTTSSITSSNHDELPAHLNESGQSETTEIPTTSSPQLLPVAQRVYIETDVLRVELDTIGGDVRQVQLLTYPIDMKKADNPYILLNDELPNVFIAQSGLLATNPNADIETAPSHLSRFRSEQSHYRLAEGDKSLQVKLTWENEAGLKVNKIYIFERNSYLIQVQHEVFNHTSNSWQGRLYGQLQRTEVALPGQTDFIVTYMGGAISSPAQRYEKIPFKKIADDSFNREKRPGWAGGWAAILQHYFLSAWIPQAEETFDYYTKNLSNKRYVLGLYGPNQVIPVDGQHTFALKLYAGPKLQEMLAQISPGLDLTVDYGWLWFIAQPLFWLLKEIYNLTGNWGWAIILLTILIKLAFFHLSATSYKSMANMRRIHPRLIALKERYGEDKARMNQAMMDLYRQEKINPLGGCLPILVQIPVFIALYWVLLESVEMRQASFMLWLQDLSSPDPYFVLPLIMGATMILQHFLNPAPLDPIQQKVMLMLPIVFTVFFAFFPSGLVLYWVVNNMLSIAQQWIITKKIVGHT